MIENHLNIDTQKNSLLQAISLSENDWINSHLKSQGRKPCTDRLKALGARGKNRTLVVFADSEQSIPVSSIEKSKFPTDIYIE